MALFRGETIDNISDAVTEVNGFCANGTVRRVTEKQNRTETDAGEFKKQY